MSRKKFESLLMKNILAVAVPAIVVFVVLAFMFLRYPLFEQIKKQSLGDAVDINETMEMLYNNQTTNVSCKLDDVRYTGLDYYVDGKLKGAYYYKITDTSLVLILVKTDKPSPVVSRTLKGRIIKDAISSNYIVNQISEQLEIPSDILKDYGCEYIISEPEYPHAFIAMVYIIFLTPIVICFFILGYTIFVWLNPENYSQCKQLANYGEPKAVIEELDNQLKNSLVYKSTNIYITSEYMVVSYFTRTDVIRLDMIKYLSKNIVEIKGLGSSFREVFRLTMSKPDTFFYEVDFEDEELVDIVIKYIDNVTK